MRQSIFHRYRMEVIATWPESEYKQITLAAAQAALRREMAYEDAGWPEGSDKYPGNQPD